MYYIHIHMHVVKAHQHKDTPILFISLDWQTKNFTLHNKNMTINKYLLFLSNFLLF